MGTDWLRVGHRGAPKEFPGNTMRSFLRAVELGCAMVECDVRQASDGVLVLAHDPHVTDTLGNRYTISENESRFLAGLDLGAGEGVPALVELTSWALGICAVMADMKCKGGEIERLVVEALSSLPFSSKIVPGAGEVSRARFRELDASLPLSLSIGCGFKPSMSNTEFDEIINSLDTNATTWEWPLLNAERIDRLHERGVRVFAWTVDDLPTMEMLLGFGVDGIISNRPDLFPK